MAARFPCKTCETPTDLDEALVCAACLREDIGKCAKCDRDLSADTVIFWLCEYVSVADLEAHFGLENSMDPTLFVPPKNDARFRRRLWPSDHDPWGSVARRHAKHDEWRRTGIRLSKEEIYQCRTKRTCWVCQACHDARIPEAEEELGGRSLAGKAWRVPLALYQSRQRVQKAER